MSLPHCQELRDAAPVLAISSAKSDESNMFFYTVSSDFYDAVNYDLGIQIYPEYEKLYEAKMKDIADHLGYAPIQYRLYEEGCPDWATGDRISVWENDRIWIRIEYEDRECPIMVILSKINETI